MDNNNEQQGSALLALVSFSSSIIAIYTFYCLFAPISLISALFCINKKNTRSIAITTIIIVAVSFVIKILDQLTKNGALPEWLTSGLL